MGSVRQRRLGWHDPSKDLNERANAFNESVRDPAVVSLVSSVGVREPAVVSLVSSVGGVTW